jgi:hypothetical protein
MFGIDGAIGAGVGTGFTADTEHIMSGQHTTLFLVLFKGLNRTGLNTMGILTASADQGIGSQFRHGTNSIIVSMLIITTL